MRFFVTSNDLASAPTQYTILSPQVTNETEFQKPISFPYVRIDDYAEDGELEELVLDHIVDYVKMPLKDFIRKVQHGGTLIINGLDAYLVAKAYTEMRITTEHFNNFIHGDENKLRLLSHTVQDVINVLLEAKFNIEFRRIDGLQYTIKAKRP